MPAPCSKGIIEFPNSEQHSCIAMTLKVTDLKPIEHLSDEFGRGVRQHQPPSQSLDQLSQ